MELHQILRMKEGEDEDSYAKNSSGQKLLITESKHLLEQSIKEFCLSGIPECINIADLGCASGPNTFLVIGMILESIKGECNRSNYKLPSIQVFLNDLVSNDFNTVFSSLPTFYGELEGKGWTSGSCFIAAVPGTFYGRLFPANSMHFMHSSSSVHWLSQVPEGLLTETGSTLNKRNICIAKESPPNVRDAYLEQFQKDFTNFLKLRSIEMVSHGHLFLNLSSSNHHSDGYNYQEILSMALNDLVAEGIVEETKLDTFNIPVYEPSIEEVRHVIENEGSFKIMHFDAWEIRTLPDSLEQIIPNPAFMGEFLAKTMKAAMGPIIASHFGDAIIDDLFSRYARKVSEYTGRMKTSGENLRVSLSKK